MRLLELHLIGELELLAERHMLLARAVAAVLHMLGPHPAVRMEDALAMDNDRVLDDIHIDLILCRAGQVHVELPELVGLVILHRGAPLGLHHSALVNHLVARVDAPASGLRLWRRGRGRCGLAAVAMAMAMAMAAAVAVAVAVGALFVDLDLDLNLLLLLLLDLDNDLDFLFLLLDLLLLDLALALDLHLGELGAGERRVVGVPLVEDVLADGVKEHVCGLVQAAVGLLQVLVKASKHRHGAQSGLLLQCALCLCVCGRGKPRAVCAYLCRGINRKGCV
ncbi:hypothetical protein GQ54DRAFT_17537 [Martensiomyces pterosporus]|nr:hypothetical protein GQ54DRAFT_17537 [Martensiomyces pterosporus]